MYSYSKTTNAFYLTSRKESYLKEGAWPLDAEDVSEEISSEFMQQPIDKRRIAGEDGLPAWVAVDTGVS